MNSKTVPVSTEETKNAYSPEKVEQAIIEIISFSKELLEMYQIEGQVLDITLGIQPDLKRFDPEATESKIELTFKNSFQYEYEVECRQKFKATK